MLYVCVPKVTHCFEGLQLDGKCLRAPERAADMALRKICWQKAHKAIVLVVLPSFRTRCPDLWLHGLDSIWTTSGCHALAHTRRMTSASQFFLPFLFWSMPNLLLSISIIWLDVVSSSNLAATYAAEVFSHHSLWVILVCLCVHFTRTNCFRYNYPLTVLVAVRNSAFTRRFIGVAMFSAHKNCYLCSNQSTYRTTWDWIYEFISCTDFECCCVPFLVRSLFAPILGLFNIC